ncbi:MAG: hypothetical protein CMN56_10910 [Sneathiella sp.]|uniref:energy transducer TonB n=1 Tax=Sneathiella sp. TaxID=1964365 RepID=UPI000C65BB9F|nr:energy transducer TonB [Sneathiella sp.]MAZ03636.1 hypothetical protein [Sneathiella sp.]
MRIGSQVVLFLLLSLVIHIALAAVWAPKEPDMQLERSAGGVALQIGSLIDSSPATASPVEPRSHAAVATDKRLTPVRMGQQSLTPEIAPKVTAKNAIVPKQVQKRPPVPPVEKKEVRKAIEGKPVEPVKAAPQSVEKVPQPAQEPLKKATKAEEISPTTSEAELSRGGTVASNQGQKNMITGSGGQKITEGGDAGTSNYRGKVRDRLLQNKFYPKLAKRFQMEGVVTFTFTIRRDGQITGLRIVNSSGHPVLDKAALRMVERSVPFDSFPADIASDSLEFNFPASYTIE